MLVDNSKKMSNRKADCRLCRIIGGLGLIGASCYVFTGVHSQHPRARPLVFLFAAGLGYTGIARLCQWLPFEQKSMPAKVGTNV